MEEVNKDLGITREELKGTGNKKIRNNVYLNTKSCLN